MRPCRSRRILAETATPDARQCRADLRRTADHATRELWEQTRTLRRGASRPGDRAGRRGRAAHPERAGLSAGVLRDPLARRRRRAGARSAERRGDRLRAARQRCEAADLRCAAARRRARRVRPSPASRRCRCWCRTTMLAQAPFARLEDEARAARADRHLRAAQTRSTRRRSSTRAERPASRRAPRGATSRSSNR